MDDGCHDLADLLAESAAGDANATDQLFQLVYDELHRLAVRLMNRERQDHTLQPTALINEAYMRLVATERSRSEHPTLDYQNQSHFIATAAKVMRHVLVNHAKAKRSIKRGGAHQRLSIESVMEHFEQPAIDLLLLDEAMASLAELDARQHQLVELRFFGGMTTAQAAAVLNISERTAYNEWAHAKAWLKCQIGDAS
ncbi:MAG: ECF-type sigma factor [Planctomycetota bacterium]